MRGSKNAAAAKAVHGEEALHDNVPFTGVDLFRARNTRGEQRENKRMKGSDGISFVTKSRKKCVNASAIGGGERKRVGGGRVVDRTHDCICKVVQYSTIRSKSVIETVRMKRFAM